MDLPSGEPTARNALARLLPPAHADTALDRGDPTRDAPAGIRHPRVMPRARVDGGTVAYVGRTGVSGDMDSEARGRKGRSLRDALVYRMVRMREYGHNEAPRTTRAWPALPPSRGALHE